MMHTILALCSRDHGHETMRSLLKAALVEFDQQEQSWDKLVLEAEIQGITPLVHKHILESGHTLPQTTKRQLLSLHLRHTRSNEIRNKTITEIVKTFKKKNIDILQLKGIALCNTVYSKPGARPMRDIDFLVKNTNLRNTKTLLKNLGFTQERSQDISADHHHLQPFTKMVQGLPISVEVHRELLSKQFNGPSWSFDNLHSTAKRFPINDITALTLNLEYNLYYLYLHGFRAPLTYESFRLIHAADLISLVELYYKEIDWNQLQKIFPAVLNVLSRLHFVTPWRPSIIEALSLDIQNHPTAPGIPYRGWPHRMLNTIPNDKLFSYIKETIWPSQWWAQIYYGNLKGTRYFKTRFFDHPQTIWRWIKAFRHSDKVIHAEKKDKPL